MDKIVFDKSNFIGKQTKMIEKDYKILEILGQGAFSVVYKAQHKVTKQLRCIKKIEMSNFSKSQEENIMNEIEVLRKIDHPNIMKIFEYYEKHGHLYIVTEYLAGGELFDRIEKEESFSERDAALYMKQILKAVAYLHSNKIVHRDIKPENIVFENEKDDSHLKLIDFGTSREVLLNKKMNTRMGTAYYIAPEVLKKCYDVKCDIWSCGVILYTFLCGYPPFNGSSEMKIIGRIVKGEFKFPKEEWGTISTNAKNIIKQMLTYSPAKRPSAEELLKDPWFHNRKQSTFTTTTKLAVVKNLKNFKAQTKLQQAILLYFVNFFDIAKEKTILMDAFEAIDKNFDGKLSKKELQDVYSQVYGEEMAKMYVNHIFKRCDFNDSNSLDFSEFLVANIDYRKTLNNKNLEKLFSIVDKDGSGKISFNELKEFLNMKGNKNDKILFEMIKEVDKNEDGAISYDEFVEMMDSFYEKMK